MSNSYYTSVFRRGDTVYIRKINEDKSRTNYSVKYKPKLYFASNELNSEYKNLKGEFLREVEFSSIKSAKEYAEAYQGKVYGYPRWEYACLDEEFPYEIEYDFNDLRVAFIDIETESLTHYSSVKNPDQPIILIQILFNDIYYIFGTQFYESYENNVKYIRCKDEIELLKKFVQVMRKFDVDIISGWNSNGYDLPMIHQRMQLLGLEDVFKKLSPFGYIETSEVEVFNKLQLRVDICGIQHLDMMELIKKFDLKKYENYKLATISKEILDKTKIEFEGDLGSLYYTDVNLFIEYGIRDVELLKEIEDEKNMIRLVVDVAYMMKVNYLDTFSQVRMWDNKFMTYLKHERNVQVPYLVSRDDEMYVEDDEKFEGAYVMPPVPNKYEWVMSDDVQSLYPSIMIAFNTSPETYIDNLNKNVEYFLKDSTEYLNDLKENDYTSLANGSRFSKKFQGFVPKILSDVFDTRLEAKNIMNDSKKMVKSIEDEMKSRGIVWS